MDKSVADKLVKARGAKTRAEAAAEIGISYRALTSYEQGWRRPSDNVKKKIADYYGMTVQALFY